MASEATKIAVRGNMHMDIRVFEVTEFKSEVKLDHFHEVAFEVIWEAATASEGTKMAFRRNMHLDTRVINVSDFKF